MHLPLSLIIIPQEIRPSSIGIRKEPSHLLSLARPNAPAAILSSIESAYILSNPFPSKPSIIFSAQKPLYSQPNYSSWWLGIFLVLISSNLINRVPRCKHKQGSVWVHPFKHLIIKDFPLNNFLKLANKDLIWKTAKVNANLIRSYRLLKLIKQRDLFGFHPPLIKNVHNLLWLSSAMFAELW